MSKLLAPNGKPSNLTPEQYKLVRTPAFKKWFGFWDLYAYGKAKNYYEPSVKKIAKELKEEKLSAINKAVDFLSKQVTENDVLIPMPSRYGFAKDTRKLAQKISEKTGAKLFDCLVGKKRESVYKMKKNNQDLSNFDFNFQINCEIPKAKNYFIVDNVIGTGVTMKNALQNVIKNIGTNVSPLVFAIDLNNISKVVDSNYEPLVVYHGTENKFNIFKISNFGQLGKGIYFSNYYNEAKGYSELNNSKKAKVIGVFLNIKNPKYPTNYELKNSELFMGESNEVYERLINLKYDGIIFKFDKITSRGDKYISLPTGQLEINAFKPNRIKLADGTNTTFDGSNPDIRFDDGGELGVENFKKMNYNELMLYIKDSYKELGAEIGIKGHTEDGEPIIGYLPYQNEYMYKSDSTGKNIRFYIDLGNERYIHPSEINPKFNVSEQKRIEQKADYFAKISNEEYNKIISELEKNNELNLVVDTLDKALKTFNIENQYDSSDIFKSYGNSTLESKDGNKRRMKFDVYYFRVNDSELKTNVKNLDLERFNNEYLKKFNNGGSVDNKYQYVVDEIENAIIDLGLPYLNGVDEFNRYYLSKSKNDFGQSWYMIFEQENRLLEIRISDHSVTSSSRIMDAKYIAMLDVSNPFKYQTPKGIAKSLDLEFKRLKKIAEIQTLMDAEQREKRDYMNNKLQPFLDKLKSENKTIGKNDRTYQTLEEVMIKHPDWEYVFHYPNNGAYSFYFVKKDTNGSLSPHFINEQYFNFLNDNNYLKTNYKTGGSVLLAPNEEQIKIKWSELSDSVKNDIVGNVWDNNKYVQENYWNSDSLKDAINDLIENYQPLFKIEYKNTNNLYNQLIELNWGISEKNIENLIEKIEDGIVLDPVILNNGLFFDGGHRLTSYKRLKIEKIPTIDIGFMLDFNYEKWDNGEIDFNSDTNFKRGGRTIAQTPAPKKERVYGSNTNKEKSSESNTSAKQIVFNDNTLKSIKNKVDKHNEENPDKLITLSSAKAVVRRGMGAYSSSHRPTIKGGKPNSRVAWGLARLNAFIYKVINGVSKSGKYTQDDDLINDLNIKYNIGGDISDASYENVKKDKLNYLDVLSNIWSNFNIKF